MRSSVLAFTAVLVFTPVLAFTVRVPQVVPEYAFLEPRGMGLWESGNVTVVLPALYRADAQDPTWRPPSNDDGECVGHMCDSVYFNLK
jgi:hypothetical protein